MHLFKSKDIGIRKISSWPFSVIYFTDEQISLWEEVRKLYRPKIIIDSTGSLVKSLEMGENKSKYIMLYKLITSILGHKKAVAISQMISERQDVNKIALWLSLSIKKTFHPVEAVIDGSLALANALCLAYNNSSYKEYLISCFDVLNKRPGATLPLIYIRLDRAPSNQINYVMEMFPKKSFKNERFLRKKCCPLYNLL